MVTVGLQGVVYLGIPGIARPTWASTPNSSGIYVGTLPTSLFIASGVRDVNLNLDMNEADVSARYSAVELVTYGLDKWDVGLDFPYDPSDAGIAALRNARAARQQIPCAILDTVAASGVQGFWFDATVLNYPLDQPLPKEMMLKIKIKPGPNANKVAPQVVQVT